MPIIMNTGTSAVTERQGSLESQSSSGSDEKSVRSARAAKVFGDLVADEVSLSYSPSPVKSRKNSLRNITNVCESSPMKSPILPFGEIQFTTVKKNPKKTSGPLKDLKKSSEKKEEKEPRVTDTEKKATVPSIYEDHDDKKTENNTCAAPDSSTDCGKDAKSKTESESLDEPQAKRKNPNGRKNKKRQIPKATKTSPVKKHVTKTKFRSNASSLARKTQASIAQNAIRLATESVNETLNASRIAKIDHHRNVAAEVSRLRDEWLAEKEAAERFYSEVENTRREMLQLRSQLASQYAQNKADSERNRLQQRLNALDREIQFKSDVYVEHKQKLKENEDNRRRLSTQVKAQIWNERRANAAKIEEERLQAEHERLEHKWAGERDAEEYKKQCMRERRESYAFRNAEGRRQRMEEEERKALELIAEHKRYEFKWAGEKDAQDYLDKCRMERRDSFAFRNAEGLRQRKEEEERKSKEKMEEHERLELKWQGEKDAEEYLKNCARERRESFAFRNAEGRRQRMEEEERKAKEQYDEHIRLEHKWEGERDAEEYRKRCEKARRESLAFRGQEVVRHRAVMEELRIIAKEKEHESYVLKWAAQDDVKQYLKKVAEERRQSLAFRNEEGKRHRDLEEEWKYEELERQHELELTRSACHKDVEEYKKKCAERDRNSLIYRGKEVQIRRMITEKQRAIEYEEDQKRRALEALARGDVDEYVEDCKRRRRLSLAQRATESRRHVQWKKKQAEIEREQKARHTRNMGLDRRYVELAKEKEKMRIALDALRHAKCTFSTSNPFGPLIE